MNTVLVNRSEPEGRRHYNLAHEAFHLLTWDVLPPQRVEADEVPMRGRANRVEQLAENFASALLMPEAEIRARWDSHASVSEVHERIKSVATHFAVSRVACKWRLHTLDVLSRADLLDINDQRLAVPASPQRVRLFSEPFVKRIAVALDTGRLSVRRAASLLALTLAELADLLQAYGFEPAFEA